MMKKMGLQNGNGSSQKNMRRTYFNRKNKYTGSIGNTDPFFGLYQTTAAATVLLFSGYVDTMRTWSEREVTSLVHEMKKRLLPKAR